MILVLCPVALVATAILWPARFETLASAAARLKSEQAQLLQSLAAPLSEPPSLKERRSLERQKPQI